MTPDALRRIVVAALLAVALTGMLVHYGAVADEEGRDEVQASHAKLAAYDDHVGERLYVWGRVVDASDEGIVVVAGGERLRVVGTDATPAPGDMVQVYGVAEPGRVVRADRVVVSSRAGLGYLYAASAVGAALAAAAFLRDWSIRWRGLLVTPRGEDGTEGEP